MLTDLLIARFPIEKGSVIRDIVTKHRHMFHSVEWKQEGPLHSGRFTGSLARPDSDQEGSKTKFLYDAKGIKLEMEKEGASVNLQMPEFTA